MKKKWSRMLLLAAAVFVCGMFAGSTMITKAENDDARIADGVYIGSVSVGGMTEQEAYDAIAAYADSVNQAVFTLTANGKSAKATAEDLGITVKNTSAVKEALAVGKEGNLIRRYKDRKDLSHGGKVFELPLAIDETQAAATLTEKAKTLNNNAVNCGLKRVNGQFEITEGSSGVEVNVAESVTAIEEYLTDSWDGTDTELELVAEVVEPKGTKEELSKVKDLLGSYNTNYSTSSAGRCKNIDVAAGKIDGTVLYPGDEFSVAATIGPLTAAGGYELAGAYENGQTVQSYGGGVCQVSTTLYNAVILAELEVTQRSNHSMIVTYVKPSMDAAIAGDYKDLKFVNNLDAPIYLEGYTSGKNLYFNIYGQETRPANRKVSYESEVVSEDNPPTQFVATGEPIGSIATVQGQHTGYVAKLWKIVTVDGVEKSREAFNKSRYKSSPRIVNVGTASADPNATAAMNAAIATGDEATIRATAAQYAGGAAPADTTTDNNQTDNNNNNNNNSDNSSQDNGSSGADNAEEDSIIGSVPESDITENNSSDGQE